MICRCTFQCNIDVGFLIIAGINAPPTKTCISKVGTLLQLLTSKCTKRTFLTEKILLSKQKVAVLLNKPWLLYDGSITPQSALWHHEPSRQKPIFNPLKKWFDETPPQVQKKHLSTQNMTPTPPILKITPPRADWL